MTPWRAWVLRIRAGVGFFFCLLALAVFALGARLLALHESAAIVLPIALCGIALFAFGAQLSLRPPVTHQRAAVRPRWPWLTASAFPLCWGAALLSVAVEWAVGLRWSASDFFTLRAAGTTLPFILWMAPILLEGQVLAHELGHFLAARLIGVRPESLQTGLVHIVRTPGGYQWALNREPGFALHGQVQISFEQARPSAGALAFFFLAGVLVNAAIGAASLFWLQSQHDAPTGALALGIMTAGISFDMVVTNLLPFRSMTWGCASDGAQLLDMLRAAQARPLLRRVEDLRPTKEAGQRPE